MTRPNGAHSNERRLFLFVYYYHFFLLFVVGLVTCPWSSTDVIYQISQQFRIVDNAILRALLDVFIRMFFFFHLFDSSAGRSAAAAAAVWFLLPFFLVIKVHFVGNFWWRGIHFSTVVNAASERKVQRVFSFSFFFFIFFLRRAANFIFHAGALVAWLFYFFFFSWFFYLIFSFWWTETRPSPLLSSG